MNEKFIELENGDIVKMSDIKKITKHYFSSHTNDLAPFVRFKKGDPIFRFLGLIPVKFAKKDGFKLGRFCGEFGSWYNKYYFSLKDLFDVMMKHWGEMSPGAFGGYSNLPNAEYSVGWRLTSNKDALYFDLKENAICVKPYVTLLFDDFNESYSGFYGHICPRRKHITFNTDKELDQWMDDNIDLRDLCRLNSDETKE